MTLPYDHVRVEPPPPRTSRLAAAALFIAAFLVGFLFGLPL